MARGESGGESSGSSGEESEPKGKISEYEKQRLDALGISKAAKALVAPSPISKRRRVKRNSGEEDDDYTPGNADDDDEDEEFLGNLSCVSRKRKVIISTVDIRNQFDEWSSEWWLLSGMSSLNVLYLLLFMNLCAVLIFTVDFLWLQLKNKASASKRKLLSKTILNTSDDEYDDLDKVFTL